MIQYIGSPGTQQALTYMPKSGNWTFNSLPQLNAMKLILI